METLAAPPAPDAGSDLAIEFLHTRFGAVDGPPGPMPLNSYDDLLAWGIKFGVLSAEDARRLRHAERRVPEAARAAYGRAIEFRAALDAVLRSPLHGRQASPADLAVLRTNEADALAAALLVPTDGGFRWTWGSESADRPLWPVVHAAIELLTTGPLDRVKACALCQFLFIDRSKNRSRRWCSMAACGTTEKMRRYTERRAARRRN
jgi:predicted RNA-binding Zn ribbon-like protein